MLQQLLSLGLGCSLILHGLVLLAFCCTVGFQIPLIEKKILKQDQDIISLFSLASFEQQEQALQSPQQTIESAQTEAPARKEAHFDIIQELPTKTIAETTPDQATEKVPYTEPATTAVETIDHLPNVLQDKEDVTQKEAIRSDQATALRSLNKTERQTLARSTFLKSTLSHTKTSTKTDFFRHAQTVAQKAALNSLSSTNTSDYSAKISGLGNLKMHSYEEKLRTALISAFNTVKHRFKPTVDSNLFSVRTAIDLVINKDGSIAQLYLVHSSGDSMFDKMIMESIQYASPFPPIPDHLGVEKYRLGGMELYVNY